MEISDPPAVLYVLGDMPAIDDQPVMTIVGSRRPTEYGAISAFNLSRALCSAGFIVVSGGAQMCIRDRCYTETVISLHFVKRPPVGCFGICKKGG